MLCRECGTENIDRARFCVGCGTPLAAPVPVTIPAAPPTPVEQPVKKARWGLLIAIGAALVVLVVCLSLFLGGGRSYNEVAEQFIVALVENDQETLSEVLHPKLYSYLKSADLLNTVKMRCEAETIGAEACTELELEELQLMYSLLGATMNFSNAYQVEVEYTVYYGTEEKTSVANVTVCEVDGDWLVVNTD